MMLTPSLLTHALLAAAFGVAAPTIKPGLAKKLPGAVAAKKANATPKPVRLRMELRMINPTHEGGPGNTEDEILYALAWQPIGEEARGKVVNRPADPDIWEMGHHSTDKLHRLLFEGNVSEANPARVAIVVGEQEGELQGVPANYLPHDPLDSFDDDLGKELIDAVKRESHPRYEHVIGAQVKIIGNKMQVVAADFAEIVEKTPTFALLRSTHATGSYELRLFLQGADTPRIPLPVWLTTEYDKCGQTNLYVHGQSTVVVKKGERKPVALKDNEFDWDCGADSDDESTMRIDTEWVDVVRALQGSEIDWVCYRKDVLAPDIEW